jgi:hypothetical protein
MTKKCKTCKIDKDISDFARATRMKDGHRNTCKSCWAAQMREYYAANEDKRIARAEYCRDYRAVIVEKVLRHYGGRCACCGETNPLFLTIDHINSDGAEHRRKLSKNGNGRTVSGDKIYRQIVKENFPEIFQVLCYNCNCGKQRNGGISCPHVSL